MSKKLINERAILIFPSLAADIGLNNAIFIQQLNYWCDIADELNYGVIHEGERWIYKSAEEWQKRDFPFWSVPTIRRIIADLVEKEFIFTKQLSKDKCNKTLYYRINREHSRFACDQIDNIEVIKLNRSKLSNCEHVTENTTEITTEINKPLKDIRVVEIFEFWKTVFNKNNSTKLEGVRERKIKARLKDGRTVEEIKTAIVNCSKSDYHVSNGYTDLELICRDDVKFEGFLNMKPKQQNSYAPKPAEPNTMDNLRQFAEEYENGKEFNFFK